MFSWWLFLTKDMMNSLLVEKIRRFGQEISKFNGIRMGFTSRVWIRIFDSRYLATFLSITIFKTQGGIGSSYFPVSQPHFGWSSILLSRLVCSSHNVDSKVMRRLYNHTSTSLRETSYSEFNGSECCTVRMCIQLTDTSSINQLYGSLLILSVAAYVFHGRLRSLPMMKVSEGLPI